MPCVSISEAAAAGVILLRGSRLTAYNAQRVNKAAQMNKEDSGSAGIVSAFTRRGKEPFTYNVRKILGF